MSEVFEGNRLETGVLQRARQWRDAIPALVLIDALRVAGSPLQVGCIWLTLVLQGLLVSLATVRPAGIVPPAEPAVGSQLLVLPAPGLEFQFVAPVEIPAETMGATEPAAAIGVDPQAWLELLAALGLARGGGLLVASLLLWLLPAAVVARAGACYVAGRPQSFSLHVRTVASRWRTLLALLAIPLAATLLSMGGMMLVGTLGRLASGGAGDWLGTVAVIASLPLAILTGLLTAGALVALPLALVAVGIEKQHDAFDSLSRGYEYLFRRPIQLAFYLVGSAGLLVVIGIAANAIAFAAQTFGGVALAVGSGGDALARTLAACLGSFSWAIVITAAWGLIGAIYLLMRQAANDQEIEDIAVSPVDLREPELPVLRQGVPTAAEEPTSE
jgi:hypothetical protein